MIKAHQNKIFSFYSFKGGVGRTQLLANIASYLCYYKDARVLILDWDMEAPGVHFFFDKRNEEIHKRGIIGILKAYTEMAEQEKTNEFSKEDYPNLYVSPDDVFSLLAPNESTKGKIDLLPAGNYSLQYDFFMQNAAFDWGNFYRKLGGGDHLENLKNDLKALEYDYIFIDSRTGINDYTNIVNIQMSDCDVLVMAPTEQNFAGCKLLANKIRGSKYIQDGYRKGFVLPILSRFVEESQDRKHWLKRFIEDFAYLLPALSKHEMKNPRKTFDEQYFFKTKLNHTQIMGEKIFFQNKEDNFSINDTLENNIINIAHFLTNIKENDAIDFQEGEENTNNTSDNKPKTDAEAYYNMGNSFAFLQKYDDAIIQYKKAIEIKPKYHEAWNNLGNSFAFLQKYDDAIIQYKKAIEIKPKYHEAWNNLGIVYAKLEEYAQAILAYKKAIETKPDDHEAWNNLGSAYAESQDYAQAILAYKKAIEIKPDDHKAWNNLGIAYAKLEEYAQAILAFQKAIEIKPDDHEAWNNLGIAYAKLENYAQALLAYKKAIKIKPDFHEVWNNLGIAYYNQQDYAQAILAFQKALEIKPEFENPIFDMACAYSLMRDKTNALAYLQKSIALNPTWKEEAKIDTDFEWLWADADFLALVGKV